MDDRCDNCDSQMQHERIAADCAFVCEDCRAWALQQAFPKLQVGIRQPREEMPDCVWRGAETPFAENH